MGADAFVVFFGVRYSIPDDDDDLEKLDSRTDPRVEAARGAGLHTYCGRLTEGEDHFLLIGFRLGVFGVENELQKSIWERELLQTMERTRLKLRDASFKEEPALHLQLDAQH